MYVVQEGRPDVLATMIERHPCIQVGWLGFDGNINTTFGYVMPLEE